MGWLYFEVGWRDMILLTGASGGIGEEIVDSLMKIDEVLGIYNKTVPKTSPENKLTYEKLNIENSEEIKMFADKWGPKLSKISLVHMAGYKVDNLVGNCSDSDWDKVMNINLRGNFLLSKAFLPYMVRQRWGRIVHISSTGGMEGAPGTLTYSTSKTGLIGMSRVFAKEYARFNITSNVLVLGTFETGMFESLQDDMKKAILDKIPSKTFGKVSNIANAIDFLIKSEYVNASVINIDGGM